MTRKLPLLHAVALSFAGLALLSPSSTEARELVLKKGDQLAIVGDSITEQKQYSRFIEDYLLACTPELGLQIFQFGWSGERAPGLANRMENDLVPWKPTVVTTAFGMNDGSYRPYIDAIGKAYEDGTRRIQDRMNLYHPGPTAGRVAHLKRPVTWWLAAYPNRPSLAQHSCPT